MTATKTITETMIEVLTERAEYAWERRAGAINKGAGFENAVKHWVREFDRCGAAIAYLRHRND